MQCRVSIKFKWKFENSNYNSSIEANTMIITIKKDVSREDDVLKQ